MMELTMTRKVGLHKGIKVLSLTLAVMVLGGCSDNDFSDLNAFIAEVKRRPAGRPEPVPEFKTYETYAYQVGGMRDPFVSGLTDETLVAETSTSTLQPDRSRNKEALEQYPLDTLKFVGSMEREGESWAIITAPDDIVYRVKVGNHAGQNHGKITAINEGRIEFVEIVPDGMGGWIERQAALSISE